MTEHLDIQVKKDVEGGLIVGRLADPSWTGSILLPYRLKVPAPCFDHLGVDLDEPLFIIAVQVLAETENLCGASLFHSGQYFFCVTILRATLKLMH